LVVKAELVRERLAALRSTLERLRSLRARDLGGDPNLEWAGAASEVSAPVLDKPPSDLFDSPSVLAVSVR
jgi:hypothetical protein